MVLRLVRSLALLLEIGVPEFVLESRGAANGEPLRVCCGTRTRFERLLVSSGFGAVPPIA